MALIICPECGKQVSDKAEICVGCGYPIAKYMEKNEDVREKDVKNEEKIRPFNMSLDEIYEAENGKKVFMIKRVREESGCSLEDAKKLVDEYWAVKFPEKELHYTPQQELPETVRTTIDVSNRFAERNPGHKIKCPKCSSIEYQIVGTKKKFSYGKALVGNAVGGLLLGPAGALAGTFSGVRGKDGKTKFVCSKCGKIWEQKI